MLLGCGQLGGEVLRVSGLLPTQLAFPLQCRPGLTLRACGLAGLHPLPFDSLLKLSDSLPGDGQLVSVVKCLDQRPRLRPTVPTRSEGALAIGV